MGFSILVTQANVLPTLTLPIRLLQAPGLPVRMDHPTFGPSHGLQCVVLEGRQSIFLIEVGLGSLDFVAPLRRLGCIGASRLKSQAFAPIRQQLVSFGYRTEDVTDIFVSHFHRAQTGGLFDFPRARVHALTPPPHAEQHRLLPDPGLLQVPRDPAMAWHGFSTHRIAFENQELLLVELPGRFRGHAGLVVPKPVGQLFYVGHAVQSLRELQGPGDFLREFAAAMFTDNQPFCRLETRSRLARLARDRRANLRFCAALDPQVASEDVVVCSGAQTTPRLSPTRVM